MDTTKLPPMPDPITPGQPAQQSVSPSISGGNKEAGPIGQRTEFVSPAPVETTPHIPQELRELGIEESPDTDKPDVSSDARQAGMQPVKTATPVTTQSQGTVQVPSPQGAAPFTLQQTTQNLKSHKADESVTWLSMLSKYILAKIGWQNTGEKG